MNLYHCCLPAFAWGLSVRTQRPNVSLWERWLTKKGHPTPRYPECHPRLPTKWPIIGLGEVCENSSPIPKKMSSGTLHRITRLLASFTKLCGFCGRGGYSIHTPGQLPTNVRPNASGGATVFRPGQLPTQIQRNIGGGFSVHRPGELPTRIQPTSSPSSQENQSLGRLLFFWNR